MTENAAFQHSSRRGRQTARTIGESAEETVAEDAAFRDSICERRPAGVAGHRRTDEADTAFRNDSCERRPAQVAEHCRTDEEDAVFQHGSRYDEGAARFEGM
jgi:hypothetical protein